MKRLKNDKIKALKMRSQISVFCVQCTHNNHTQRRFMRRIKSFSWTTKMWLCKYLTLSLSLLSNRILDFFHRCLDFVCSRWLGTEILIFLSFFVLCSMAIWIVLCGTWNVVGFGHWFCIANRNRLHNSILPIVSFAHSSVKFQFKISLTGIKAHS